MRQRSGRRTARQSSVICCPLCKADAPAPLFARGRQRSYFRCAECALVFVDSAGHVTFEAERQRYLQHDNSAADAGYVAHLMRLVDAVRAHVPAGSAGLDFGCGPQPVLAQLLNDAAYPTSSYDPYFFPDAAVLAQRYDFITCSEVVEHARAPRVLFDELGALVRPGGTIAIMTQLYDGVEDFAEWWYQRDATHVSFYCKGTMRWIARDRDWTAAMPADNIVLFTTRQDT